MHDENLSGGQILTEQRSNIRGKILATHYSIRITEGLQSPLLKRHLVFNI